MNKDATSKSNLSVLFLVSIVLMLINPLALLLV
uniref:Uncharacterized protein n=1 Tax=virus sp. ctML55 TaxID=2827627 RepID=A0A8S5RHP7_9VIRU|nr:MAG TPA: hypothetical protein [virus sp. ctML55]